MPCGLFERAAERHHCFAAGRTLASRGVQFIVSKGTVQRESPAPSCRRRDGGRR
jgi:hypothetical protein